MIFLKIKYKVYFDIITFAYPIYTAIIKNPDTIAYSIWLIGSLFS